MRKPAAPETFAAALDGLVRQIEKDRSILAAVLGGSLAHDTVWEKSDIDLVLITVDDRKVPLSDVSLNADGINVHTLLVPRGEFRKMVEGALANSFMHSFLAKGRLLFTHDPSITELCARLQSRGSRDTKLQMLVAAMGALPALYKARKWLLTRGDCAYTSLWILYAASSVARLEVIGAGLLADREVIPQALKLNPKLFDAIYTRLFAEGTKKTAVEAALRTLERHLASRARDVFSPIIDYLEEVGDVRSAHDIEDHFQRNFGLAGVMTACEYLADLGIIGKASAPVQLTRRSNTSVEELAFYATKSDGR